MKKTKDWFYLLLYFYAMAIWASDYFRLISLDHLNLNQEALQFASSLEKPDIDTQVVAARIYIKNKKWQKANTLLDSLMVRYPQDSDIYLLKIMVLEQQGHYQEALNWTYIGLLFFPFDPQFYPKKWHLENIQPSIIISQPKKSEAPKNFVLWAKNQLKKSPKDADIALKLAQFYMKNKQYDKIDVLLQPYLKMYPHYIDLYLVNINADIQMKKYHQALALCQKGLEFSPHHKDLLKKQSDLKYLISAPVKKTEIVPEKQTELLNEAGFYNQLYYITDRKQLWDYTTLFYGRQTEMGKVYGKLNYANRLNTQAVQYEFEFFPKLGQYIYLDLDASVANQPILFPHYSYAGEAFVILPELFQFSLGSQFNRITSNLQFSRMTSSFSKEFLKDLTTTFRTYFYFPGSGQNSIFYTLNFRQMLKDPFTYLGIALGTGTTPDLANLETVNFLVLKNKIMVSPYLNLATLNERLILNFSFLYQSQIFPNQRQRDWIGGTMGATWRF